MFAGHEADGVNGVVVDSVELFSERKCQNSNSKMLCNEPVLREVVTCEVGDDHVPVDHSY